jgi:hypothetical protein
MRLSWRHLVRALTPAPLIMIPLPVPGFDVMMKRLTSLLSVMLVCRVAGPVVAQTTEDERLQAFFKSYLEVHFRQQPTAATGLGDHRFDARLDDISPEARAGWRELAKRMLRELPRKVDYSRLSRDGQIDFEVFRSDLQRRLWLMDQLRVFERDPRVYGGYLNDSVYLLLAQSTEPKETNIANAVARMEQMPRIAAEARRSLTHPSRPILETAIRQNAGAIRFYETELFNYTGATPQEARVRAAAVAVAAELREYQKFLEGPARTRALDNWRLGKSKFARKFALETEAGVTAAQNLADAQAEFARVQGELHVVARQLWPRYFPQAVLPPDDAAGRRETVARVVGAVGREHSTADQLVTSTRATVEGIREFIRGHDYLRLPEPDRCAVIEMPEFRRGNSLAYLEGAPPLDPRATSHYAVSPPPADWTASEVRSFLEEYNEHMLKILTIHEAYPGHYVQLEYANQQPSLIRRVIQSDPFIEGWAVYGEVTMLNAGYGEGDLRLRLMQLKFYLRAVANTILDYRMHCTDMSDAEAMRFLTVDAFQTEGEAKLKIIRAKQSSVQLSTYFVGRMAHCRLRQEIQRELGDGFDTGRYHEAVLAQGSIAPKYLPELVRRRLAQPR